MIFKETSTKKILAFTGMRITSNKQAAVTEKFRNLGIKNNRTAEGMTYPSGSALGIQQNKIAG